MPGWEISPEMEQDKWDAILEHPQIVFARTSPQQKLVIVENNQVCHIMLLLLFCCCCWFVRLSAFFVGSLVFAYGCGQVTFLVVQNKTSVFIVFKCFFLCMLLAFDRANRLCVCAFFRAWYV